MLSRFRLPLSLRIYSHQPQSSLDISQTRPISTRSLNRDRLARKESRLPPAEYRLPPTEISMPKPAQRPGSSSNGGIQKSNPYAGAQARKGKSAAANNIFKMNTDIGQHILKNPGVAQAIVDKADLKQSDIVLEIGPGTGNLTARILEKAKKVIAVEQDPRMAAEVTKRFQGTPYAKKLELILGDAIKMPTFPYFDVCISNTPYQISSPLTFRLLATSPSPRSCVLMFQREFAMRLFARPGDKLFSRLSVNAQMWARVDHVMKVGRNNFNPPPQVESNVVRITPKNPRPQISYDEWDGLLRICFVRKNRVLRSAFLGTTSVMDMLESNYRTFCAQNDILLDDSPMDSNMEVDSEAPLPEDDEPDMDVDAEEDDIPSFFKEAADERAKKSAGNPNRKRKGRVAELVRAKVNKVLVEDTELADKRARMCDEGDFLRLLYACNQEGIHFS
jgi:18S rRNA (adenine1779-N6/adenine1780-N6)-dimethyltransferase